MNEITCSHGNGPECSKCEALDIPEVEELERELRARIADLEAERDKCNGLLQGYITTLAECVVKRDAARAGEARAVEAIKGLLNQLHEFDFEIDGSVEFFDSVQQCRDATDNTQPALDWLAQQRAEAARIERQLQAMLMQHRHDIRDLGQLLQDERCKVAAVEAERDAARAGEARAVEALRSVRGACVDVLTYCGPQQQEDIEAIMACVDGAIYAHEFGDGASWLA